MENVQSNKKPAQKKKQSGNKNDVYFEKKDGKDILKIDNKLANKSKYEPSTKLNSTNTKINITIIGDSLIRQCMDINDNIHIKSFRGASVEGMVDYVKPFVKFKPDTFVLHCLTNLAKEIKTNENDIISSIIVTRNDALNMR